MEPILRSLAAEPLQWAQTVIAFLAILIGFVMYGKQRQDDRKIEATKRAYILARNSLVISKAGSYASLNWRDISEVEKMGKLVGAETAAHLRRIDVESLEKVLPELDDHVPRRSSAREVRG
ncbi:MAG: hypothetical protein EOP21_03935 [Hyphomicrobiales bacterium]|nr:MAG: hypothetical protein EOP21_03935 [Hyphomicrobiales bacterium]